MKTILKILLLSVWSFISFVVSVKYIIPPIDSTIVSYFLIWLIGFSIGGFIMQHLIKHENSKNKDNSFDYNHQYSNVKKVPPAQSKAPPPPPRQR